jgi:hypothetical protein
MSRIYIPTKGAADWRALLADPVLHWKSGYSAMSAALSWEAAQGLPTEIAALFGADAEMLLAIPEHKVALPGGRRESQCDIFSLVKAEGLTYAVAIEAKVNEPFGPSLGEWMKTPTPGRIERLSAICALLGCATSPPPQLRYQLFHRAAAAVIEAKRFKTDAAAMIIQSFSPSHKWFDEFAAFCQFLGLSPSRGTSLAYQLPDGRNLALGWATSPLPTLTGLGPECKTCRDSRLMVNAARR